MARRKVIFVIVEGPSDDIALGAILNNIFDKNSVFVQVMHGDITSDIKIKPQNVKAYLGNIVKNYANDMHFKASNFLRVIHIVDMDGAFINENKITYNQFAEKTQYHQDRIDTNNISKIIKRNEHKQKILNSLHRIHKIWKTIDYKVFYMSCNLDHVLYDKLNSSDTEKENDAYIFAQKYKDNTNSFLEFISNSSFSIISSYDESWNFIKEDSHSLERYSNLGICFS